MLQVFQKVSDSRSDTAENLRRQYVELVYEAVDGEQFTKSDIAHVDELLSSLGISPAEADADAQAVMRMRELDPIAAGVAKAEEAEWKTKTEMEGYKLETRRQHLLSEVEMKAAGDDKISSKKIDEDAERKRVINRTRDPGLVKAREACEAAISNLARCREAAAELSRLREKHARVAKEPEAVTA